MKRTKFVFIILPFFFFIAVHVTAAGELKPALPRIAVLDFTAAPADAAMAVASRNLFEVSLHRADGLELLERSQVARILKEQEFRKDRCGDAGCAIIAGKMLSADMIIIGAYLKKENYIATVKCVDIVTGKIIAAESASSKTEDEFSLALEAASSRIAKRITESSRTGRDYTGEYRVAVAAYGAYSIPFGGGASDFNPSYALNLTGSVYVLRTGIIRPFFSLSADYSPYRRPSQKMSSYHVSLIGLNCGFGISLNVSPHVSIKPGGAAGPIFSIMKSRLGRAESCDAAASAFLELEFTIIRGYYIAAYGSYTRVFYQGKDINRVNTGGGMGYRF